MFIQPGTCLGIVLGTLLDHLISSPHKNSEELLSISSFRDEEAETQVQNLPQVTS